MAAFDFLTGLAILLLVGIVLTVVSKKLRIPNVLVLILAGYVLSLIQVRGAQLINFSNDFLEAIAIIALIMIVFDSTSRFQLRRFSAEAYPALKFSALFLLINLVVVSLAAHSLFGWDFKLAVLFAAIMAGTDAGSVLSILQGMKHKVISFLKVESLVNTPLTVILPFVVIDFSRNFNIDTFVESSIEQFAPFLQQIITGVGAGIVVALIVLRIMRKQYSEILSPVTLISSALLTYILAEALGGSGVLAVTTLGIFFGNVYIKRKESLRTFGSLFSNLFEILVFLLLGLALRLPTSGIFYAKAFVLLIIYLSIRALVTWIMFRKKFSRREMFFTALSSPKGVAVAVVIFSLVSLGLASPELVDLSIIFILYSVLISTIMVHFSKKILGVKAKI